MPAQPNRPNQPTRPTQPRQPGLDPAALAGLLRPHPATATLRHRIRAHLDAHDGYVALSGGKDSLVTLHLTLAVEPNVPVVFFDSGLEFPETYAYLHILREALDLRLHWIRAKATTLEVLAASGTWDHRAQRATVLPSLHEILISEPAARAHAEHGPGELWGVRAQESRGRAALYATALRAETARSCHGCCPPPPRSGPQHPRPQQLNLKPPDVERPEVARRRHHGGLIRRADATVALGPLWDWKTTDVWAYIARHTLPVNPVYAKLRALGAPEHFLRVSHMLDAHRLEEGRATWLRRGWPNIFEDLATVLPRIREYV